MSNYNSQLQSNNTDLQTVLQTLQTKATAGQATPEISVSSNGLITATAGIKSSTHQLAFQPAKTVTPGTASQIAVSSGHFTGGNVMVAGDANLVAGNIKSGVSIFGVSGTLVEGGGSGEDTSIEDGLITKTLSEYTNSRVSSIGTYAFYNCSKLTSVSFPACKTIGSYAFQKCFNLTTVSFPVCTSISAYAFQSCYKLTSVSFPVCKTIGSSAINRCSNLTTASFPVCTSINAYAFTNCSNLTTVSFPVCTSIGAYTFQNCSKLTSVSFPACKTIDGNGFYSCSSLTSVSFPACTSIALNAFNRCYNLSQLYLAGPSVCTLANSNAFSSTPYAGYSAYFSGTPYIYVPASLVSAYQSATNWTYFSSYFSAIEGEGDGSANLITFTIEGTEYQAEEGMTWAEWVESEYNIDKYYIGDDNYVYLTNDRDVTLSGHLVTSSALIQSGVAYDCFDWAAD